MAVWQFDLAMIPRARLSQVGVRAEDHLDQEQFESVDWWAGLAPPPDFRNRILAFLPWAKPWADGWDVYGSEEGDRLDVITGDDGQVLEMRARIDVRALKPELLEELCTFAGYCECVFVTPELRVVEPEAQAIWVELQLSPAYQFVENPEDFLRHLSQRGRSRK